MKRTVILLLDSFGLGGAEDADKFVGETADGKVFNDVGSNTLGHIAKECFEGRAEEGRSGPLKIPNLNRLGFGRACEESSGMFPCRTGCFSRTHCCLRLCQRTFYRERHNFRSLGNYRCACRV